MGKLWRKSPSAVPLPQNAVKETQRQTIKKHLAQEIDRFVHLNAEGSAIPSSSVSFRDKISAAKTYDEVIAAADTGLHTRAQLSRAIHDCWKDVKDEMPYATKGIKRWASIGSVTMSVVTLVLTLSGAPLGAGVAFAIGLGICVACVVFGLSNYWHNRRRLLRDEDGTDWLSSHKEVMRGLVDVCVVQGLKPNDPLRVEAERALSVLKGKFWFMVVEVIKGTALEPFFTLGTKCKRAIHAWRTESRHRRALNAAAVRPSS